MYVNIGRTVLASTLIGRKFMLAWMAFLSYSLKIIWPGLTVIWKQDFVCFNLCLPIQNKVDIHSRVG